MDKHKKYLFLYTSTGSTGRFYFFFLEVVETRSDFAPLHLSHKRAGVLFQITVRLSSDLLLLLPNIEKNGVHIHATTLAQLLHTLYSQGQKQGKSGVCHLSSLMLLLFVFRKQHQTCAHISYSDTFYDPTVQPMAPKNLYLCTKVMQKI